MARDLKRPQRTEVLSMRLDPRTRFQVGLLARIRGQSITTVVERAIQEAADNLKIGETESKIGKTWMDYWHISEGVRSINLALDSNTFPTYDEEAMLAFMIAHSTFFFEDKPGGKIRVGMVDILWPNMNRYLDTWSRTKTTNYFAAGREMSQAIISAGVQPPEWPPKPSRQPEAPPKPAPPAGKSAWDAAKKQDAGSDLDDDIPF